MRIQRGAPAASVPAPAVQAWSPANFPSLRGTPMQITGDMLIGASVVRGTATRLQAINPATGEALGPDFHGGGAAEAERACALAEQAFDIYRATSPEARATFLEAIADGIEALGDTLVQRAHLE